MIPRLAELVAESKHLVAFTGAGVSTLSGLPDFRGKNGLYSGRPDAWKIFDLETFHRDPSVYYQGTRSLLYADHDLSASLVHHTLARWQKEGRLKALITQNVDLLHQKAGSTEVIEVHGSPLVHHCLACGTGYDYPEMAAQVQAGRIPLCPCGGTIKPDITFFGEALPEAAFARARREVSRADLLLVLGTSLTVQPAASLPSLCLRSGGRVVIVNEQPTEMDPLAILVLRDLEEAFEGAMLWP